MEVKVRPLTPEEKDMILTGLDTRENYLQPGNPLLVASDKLKTDILDDKLFIQD